MWQQLVSSGADVMLEDNQAQWPIVKLSRRIEPSNDEPEQLQDNIFKIFTLLLSQHRPQAQNSTKHDLLHCFINAAGWNGLLGAWLDIFYGIIKS